MARISPTCFHKLAHKRATYPRESNLLSQFDLRFEDDMPNYEEELFPWPHEDFPKKREVN